MSHGSVSDLFVILKQKASYKDRLILIWLCISYSITGVHFVGYPLWYQTPEFFCIEKATEGPLKEVTTYSQFMEITNDQELYTDQFFRCSLADACSEQYNYIIDERGIWSLKSQFDLVCENDHIEKQSLSLMLQGSLVGCIINLFYRANPKHRKNVVAYFAILYGILSIFSSLLANTNIYMVSWACFAYHVVYQLNFGNYFTLFSERFDEEVAKVAPCFVFICLGTYGIIYPFLALITKSNWQILMSFHGACAIVCGLFIKKLEFDDEQLAKEAQSVQQSLLDDNADDSRLSKEIEEKIQQDDYFLFNLDQFQELFKHKDLLLNFVLLIFGYAALMVTLLLLEIEMESLAGSIYVNLMIGSVFLIGGALCSGIVLMKYSGFNALIVGFYISGFSLMFYIFAPLELSHLSILLQVFWNAPGLLNVLIVECFQDVLIAIIPAFFEVELIPIFLSIAQLISSWIITYIPKINHLLIEHNMFPYVFYGSWLAISGFIFQFFVKIDKEKFDEVNQNIHELVNENSILIATGTIQQTVRSSYAIKKEDIDQSRGNSSIVRYSYMNKNNVSQLSNRQNDQSGESKQYGNTLDIPKQKNKNQGPSIIEMIEKNN